VSVGAEEPVRLGSAAGVYPQVFAVGIGAEGEEFENYIALAKERSRSSAHTSPTSKVSSPTSNAGVAATVPRYL
jgi:hypothetical protein